MMERCGQVLQNEVASWPAFHADDASAAPDVLSFESSASALDVARVLLWRFGPYSVGARSPSATIMIPSGLSAIELIGDIVIGDGELFSLQADQNADVALILGNHQIRVASGGKLSVVRVTLSNATAGATLVIVGG
jgi:hypothetical protein